MANNFPPHFWRLKSRYGQGRAPSEGSLQGRICSLPFPVSRGPGHPFGSSLHCSNLYPCLHELLSCVCLVLCVSLIRTLVSGPSRMTSSSLTSSHPQRPSFQTMSCSEAPGLGLGHIFCRRRGGVLQTMTVTLGKSRNLLGLPFPTSSNKVPLQ